MELIQYLIVGTLFLILILSIILFVKLYLKIKSSDKNEINLIEFPKETEKKINIFIENNKKFKEELKNFLLNEHNSAQKIIKNIDDKLAPFEKVAREKNDELKEYKKGYEYSRYKALLDGIIETITFIESSEKKIKFNDEITKSYFESTKEKLLILLNNSGIEPFVPELNIQSLDHQGCEVDINTEPTNEKNKNNLIHSIISRGYKINLKDQTTHYIKKALVRVYEFKEK